MTLGVYRVEWLIGLDPKFSETPYLLKQGSLTWTVWLSVALGTLFLKSPDEHSPSIKILAI